MWEKIPIFIVTNVKDESDSKLDYVPCWTNWVCNLHVPIVCEITDFLYYEQIVTYMQLVSTINKYENVWNESLKSDNYKL